MKICECEFLSLSEVKLAFYNLGNIFRRVWNLERGTLCQMCSWSLSELRNAYTFYVYGLPPHTRPILVATSVYPLLVLLHVLRIVLPVVRFLFVILPLPTLGGVLLPRMTTTGRAFGWMVLHLDDAFGHNNSVLCSLSERSVGAFGSSGSFGSANGGLRMKRFGAELDFWSFIHIALQELAIHRHASKALVKGLWCIQLTRRGCGNSKLWDVFKNLK